MVEPDRAQMAIQCMYSTCWISKGTDTHSEYEVLIALQQQQRLHECATMLCSCVLGLSCVNFTIHKVFFFCPVNLVFLGADIFLENCSETPTNCLIFLL